MIMRPQVDLCADLLYQARVHSKHGSIWQVKLTLTRYDACVSVMKRRRLRQIGVDIKLHNEQE